MKRVDAAIISLVVVEYDAEGRPVREEQTQPLKMFVTALGDLPAQIEKLNAGFGKADGE
jgi:hypothetical protein